MAKRKVSKPAGKIAKSVRPKPRKKSAAAAPSVDATAPSELVMPLFAPGMTVMHRAGLGGLASTLRALEWAVKQGKLSANSVPGGPWPNGKPPWLIEPDRLTLRFGKPEAAGEFLKRLFAYAFQITKQGLIYLPGQFGGKDASSPILADLQQGLILTFLQHNQTRTLAKEPATVSYDPESKGAAQLIVEYRKCSWYKHQDQWTEMVDRKGRMSLRSVEVIGPLNPGAVVRHVAYSAATRIEDPPARALPLCFALVGCLVLPINNASAALLTPEAGDLAAFGDNRSSMTPLNAISCHVASAADGALQAQIRLRAAKLSSHNDLPGCHAMTFGRVSWDKKQKYRVSTLSAIPSDANTLKRFEQVLQNLPPRIEFRTVYEKLGKGKQAKTVERQVAFRADSVIRPLVAENLARGQPWYQDFAVLMTARGGRKEPLRYKVSEKKGLPVMIKNSTLWNEPAHSVLVHAVHEAIRCRFGKIANENADNEHARENRWKKEREQLRLAFAGSKTADQCRSAICGLFGRAGSNKVLKESWEQILPLLNKEWQLARDLALLALASYAGQGADEE